MPPEIKKYTQKIRHRAEVLAVEALDDIVSDLIQANKFSVSRSFLDWVNLNATDFVVDRLKKSATKDYLQAAIDSENARMTMRQLVGGWVMPHIQQQFKDLTSCDNDFQDSLSASLGMPTIDFVI
jgi:hypothetical protein